MQVTNGPRNTEDGKVPKDTTDFGFTKIPIREKSHRVAEVFHSVANRYDLMNDLMSLGIHRLWKRFAIELAAIRPGETVLDLAGGTGDLAAAMARKVGDAGRVVLSDINASMLKNGRDRLLDEGLSDNVRVALANAETLPFPDSSFDCITIAFGLRNVTDKQTALDSMYRCLRPGGRLIVLEFSHVRTPALGKLYHFYSFSILPWLGEKVTNDRASYQYLAESIRMHPNQEKLKTMLQTAGLERCDVHNLSGGIVAIHRGFRL